MASKGIVRTGEAYCLVCYEMVERSSGKCLSCGADLTEEVKAFLCPKCKTVMTLGDSQCPNCGLRFKVKTVKPPEPKEDDRLLVKLMELGKAPQGTPLPSSPPGPSEAKAAPARRPPEQLQRLAQLKGSITELMNNRSEMLARMEARLDEQKARLAKISSAEDDGKTAEAVEQEVMDLASEMADITMLQAHMENLADEISALMDSVDIDGPARERGLAAKALRMKLSVKEKELEELRAREQQLTAKEDMVDRKIQAYAQKKKQMDADEEDLKQKLMQLEQERSELERMKDMAGSARTESERAAARNEWDAERKKTAEKLKMLHDTMGKSLPPGHGVPALDVEEDLDAVISAMENSIGALIADKADLQKKMSEAKVVDEDLRKLLKVLDAMLGELPKETIERFSVSDDFTLYERILDRLKI